jgi:hypothetical protein
MHPMHEHRGVAASRPAAGAEFLAFLPQIENNWGYKASDILSELPIFK